MSELSRRAALVVAACMARLVCVYAVASPHMLVLRYSVDMAVLIRVTSPARAQLASLHTDTSPASSTSAPNSHDFLAEINDTGARRVTAGRTNAILWRMHKGRATDL